MASDPAEDTERTRRLTKQVSQVSALSIMSSDDEAADADALPQNLEHLQQASLAEAAPSLAVGGP